MNLESAEYLEVFYFTIRNEVSELERTSLIVLVHTVCKTYMRGSNTFAYYCDVWRQLFSASKQSKQRQEIPPRDEDDEDDVPFLPSPIGLVVHTI